MTTSEGVDVLFTRQVVAEIGVFWNGVRRKLFRNHGLPRIAGVGHVGPAHIRVVVLRRVLSEVPSIESLKVRPLELPLSPNHQYNECVSTLPLTRQRIRVLEFEAPELTCGS